MLPSTHSPCQFNFTSDCVTPHCNAIRPYYVLLFLNCSWTTVQLTSEYSHEAVTSPTKPHYCCITLVQKLVSKHVLGSPYGLKSAYSLLFGCYDKDTCPLNKWMKVCWALYGDGWTKKRSWLMWSLLLGPECSSWNCFILSVSACQVVVIMLFIIWAPSIWIYSLMKKYGMFWSLKCFLWFVLFLEGFVFLSVIRGCCTEMKSHISVPNVNFGICPETK